MVEKKKLWPKLQLGPLEMFFEADTPRLFARMTCCRRTSSRSSANGSIVSLLSGSGRRACHGTAIGPERSGEMGPALGRSKQMSHHGTTTEELNSVLNSVLTAVVINFCLVSRPMFILAYFIQR